MNLPSASSFYIPSLDGVRAIAVLIVLLSHAGLGDWIPGGLGVTAFFFLSGFLITTLLMQEYAEKRTISIRRFYARRMLRLAPPLVITLLIAYGLTGLGLHPGGASWEGFTAQLLYFANYYSIFFDAVSNTPRGTGVFWSLSVEEHFYILYPALFLMVVPRLGFRRFAGLLIVICGAVLIWRMYLVYGLEVSTTRTFYATDTRVDAIAIGCILALLASPVVQDGRTPPRHPRRDGALFALGAMVLLSTLVFRDSGFRETLRYTIQSVALLPLFYCCILYADHGPFRLLNGASIKRVGVYSYSIYLIHHIVIHQIRDRFPAVDNPWLVAALAFIVAMGFAHMVEHGVDSKLRSWRKALR